MRKIMTLLASLTLLVAVTSCEIDAPTSGYAVYFKCDMAFSPFDQITSFGQFITVRNKNSHRSYEVTDATGNVTTHNLTDLELRNPYNYGLGGLIIGTPSMCDGEICVYDWACPTCDNARYRLEIARDATGQATCPNCGVVYDLNIGGIPIKGKGRTLWRYKYSKFGTEVLIIN